MSTQFPAAGTRWRFTPAPALSFAHKDWLTRGGSLTRHLQSLGRVAVVVVHETVIGADDDEHGCLGVPRRTPVWSRDVLLTLDGQPVVAAHSVARLADSRTVWRAMRRLRTRPLADLLYQDTSVTRSPLVCRALPPNHRLHRIARATAAEMPLASRLWARRSVFLRHGAPLLVTEAFLPCFWRRLKHGPQLLHETPAYLETL